MTTFYRARVRASVADDDTFAAFIRIGDLEHSADGDTVEEALINLQSMVVFDLAPPETAPGKTVEFDIELPDGLDAQLSSFHTRQSTPTIPSEAEILGYADRNVSESQKQPTNSGSEETLLGEVRKGGVAHNLVIANAWITATPTDISLVTEDFGSSLVRNGYADVPEAHSRQVQRWVDLAKDQDAKIKELEEQVDFLAGEQADQARMDENLALGDLYCLQDRMEEALETAHHFYVLAAPRIRIHEALTDVAGYIAGLTDENAS